MTCIAYRDGVMAADSLVSSGDAKVGQTRKISRNQNGDLCGAAGFSGWAASFRKWFEDGEKDEVPLPKSDWGKALIVRAMDRSLHVYDDTGTYQIETFFYALGSGAPEARGAMAFGANAETAVHIAIELDSGCGGKVTVLTHDR